VGNPGEQRAPGLVEDILDKQGLVDLGIPGKQEGAGELQGLVGIHPLPFPSSCSAQGFCSALC